MSENQVNNPANPINAPSFTQQQPPQAPQVPGVQIPQAPQVPGVPIQNSPVAPTLSPSAGFMQQTNTPVNITRQNEESQLNIVFVGFISPQRNCLKKLTVNQKLARDYYKKIIDILSIFDGKDDYCAAKLATQQMPHRQADGSIKKNADTNKNEVVSLAQANAFSIKAYRSFFWDPSFFDFKTQNEETAKAKEELSRYCYSALASQDFYTVDMSEDKPEFLIFRNYTSDALNDTYSASIQWGSAIRTDNDKLFMLTEKQLRSFSVSARKAKFEAGVDYIVNDASGKQVHNYNPAGTISFVKKKTRQSSKDNTGKVSAQETKETVVLKYYTREFAEAKPRDLMTVNGDRLVTVPHRNMTKALESQVTEEQIVNLKTFKERWDGVDATKLGLRLSINTKDYPDKEAFKAAKTSQLLPFNAVSQQLVGLGISESIWQQLATPVKDKRTTSLNTINKQATEALQFLLVNEERKNNR